MPDLTIDRMDVVPRDFFDATKMQIIIFLLGNFLRATQGRTVRRPRHMTASPIVIAHIKAGGPIGIPTIVIVGAGPLKKQEA